MKEKGTAVKKYYHFNFNRKRSGDLPRVAVSWSRAAH